MTPDEHHYHLAAMREKFSEEERRDCILRCWKLVHQIKLLDRSLWWGTPTLREMVDKDPFTHEQVFILQLQELQAKHHP